MAGFRHENNFRELGGLKTKDGRIVKKGMLYRSGALASMDERELAAVKKMGLKSVIDLRGFVEEVAYPDPPIDGATNYHLSALVDNDGNEVSYSTSAMLLMAAKEPGINKMQSLGKHLYAYIAFDNAAYKKMFDLLLEERAPMLFHCSQGKDRTGVAAILILLALGVDETAILDDYELTNKYRKTLIKKEMYSHKFLARLSKNAHTFLWIKEGVYRAFGQNVIDTINARYPNYEAFFKAEYDLSHDDLERLRDFYLEDPAEEAL